MDEAEPGTTEGVGAPENLEAPGPFAAGVHLVPFGRPSLDLLGQLVAQAKGGDPLAPLTVVAPSTLAAMSIRRSLARNTGGLVGLTLVSMPQLAERLVGPDLAADGGPPLTAVVQAALVRGALAEAGGRLGGLSGTAIEASLSRTFTELAQLDEADLDRLAAGGERAAEVVALHRSFRERARGHLDPVGLTRAATTAVRARAGRQLATGPVVVHLPGRLAPTEIELVEALAADGPVAVLLGVTGVADVDAATLQLASRLTSSLGPPRHVGRTASPAELTLVRAPDPDEEVRAAVRTIISVLDEVPAERIAVSVRMADPYLLALHERLVAAGVPHHGPAVLTAAQTIAGRTLAGLVDLPRGGFRRADLFRWLRSAPMRGPDGARVPVVALERQARRAGVSAGVDQWTQRLARRRAELEGRAAELEASDDPDTARRLEATRRALTELERLSAFVAWLVERCEPPPALSWASMAGWATDALHALLGRPGRQLDWDEHEVSAYESVESMLEQLAMLDGVEGSVSFDLFARVLRDELARPSLPIGRLGHGVALAPSAQLVGGSYDLVIVVGMAEGWCPPRVADDPVLPDRLRSAVDSLPGRRTDRAAEHRDHLALLASSPRAQLSFARGDTRAGRELLPARWWLDGLGRLTGGTVFTDDVDSVRHPDFVDLASFVQAPLAGAVAVDESELLTGSLLRVHDVTGAASVVDACAGVDARLGLGATAVVDRMAGRFSQWTGRVGGAPRSAGPDEGGVGSATRFEQWATCPARYFYDRVLGVRALDERPDAEAIDNLDRGTLVHTVLERFHGDQLGRDPDAAFGPDELAELRAIATEEGDELASRGLTGRPLLWRLAAEEIHRRLATVLDNDSTYRRAQRVSPIGVEVSFGPDGAVAPVTVELAGGRRVTFRGSIDRVDRSPDGSRAVVLDYKTGRDTRYTGLPARRDRVPADITDRGRHLQLALYGEAARQLVGAEAEVSAYYWFVDKPKLVMRGGPIGEPERARLVEVLDTIVAGIEAGFFPANPGDENLWGHENCGFCSYDQLCPGSRGDLWEELRRAPELESVVELIDGPSGEPT